jgi:hypothetical protein
MRFLTYLSLIFLAISCDSEEESVRTEPTAISWSGGYPKIAQGATTVDILMKTETSAEVYYVLSDKPFNFSPEDLKQKAEFPDTSAIKFSGKLELNGGTELTKSISLLFQNTDYFTYVVTRNPSGNILSEVKSFPIRTHIRQDTATFVSTSEERTVQYLVYRPEEVLKYPEKDYPVCFSFGDKYAKSSGDITLIRDGSLAEYIHLLHDVPMIVISIQSITPDWNIELISEGIAHVQSSYPVDEKKIYLTGYGEGAVASWNYAMGNPEQIAAIAPVSGRGNVLTACNLSTVDVWAFHNETDNIISSSNTKKMVTEINKCPPEKELSATYFPDSGHNCWKRVYNSGHSDWNKSPGVEKVNLYTWMLSKSKM